MNPLFPGQEGKEKSNFGDAVISNSKYSCTKCPLKPLGCKFIVNSINCELANVRMRKILADEKDKEMEKEENTALSDYFNTLGEEKPTEEQIREAKQNRDDDD